MSFDPNQNPQSIEAHAAYDRASYERRAAKRAAHKAGKLTTEAVAGPTRRQRLADFIANVRDWREQTTGISDLDIFVRRLLGGLQEAKQNRTTYIASQKLANPLLANKFLERITDAFGEPIHSVKDVYAMAHSPTTRHINERFNAKEEASTALQDYYQMVAGEQGNPMPMLITDPVTKDRTLLTRPTHETIEGVLYAFSGGELSQTKAPLDFTLIVLPRAQQ